MSMWVFRDTTIILVFGMPTQSRTNALVKSF